LHPFGVEKEGRIFINRFRRAEIGGRRTEDCRLWTSKKDPAIMEGRGKLVNFAVDALFFSKLYCQVI
jgi:hypothetical protein